jgi:hypothetical protein
MALVTTFMTGPALNLIGYIFKNKKHVEAVESIEESKYRILILEIMKKRNYFDWQIV